MSVRRVDGNEGREEAVSVQRQRLREKIGDVPSTAKMPHQELALRDPVDQPVQVHVASFRQLCFDGLAGDADSRKQPRCHNVGASAAGGSQGRRGSGVP